MKICVAGEGAFGNKHLDALAKIDGVEVASLVGGVAPATEEVAKKYNIPHWTLDLAEGMAQPGIEAVILTTPTPIHARQAEQAMRAGKHVLVEIPMADNIADAERLVKLQKETGLVAMVGHVRRFNPSHQWVHRKMAAGELKLQQFNATTYFFRRTNLNALGQPRSWTDHLLWHHACHAVDLFLWQTGEVPVEAQAVQGPLHPELGIAMDMGLQLKSASGAIFTLSLSFNNNGPLGSFYRYICDNGTYIARYDELVDGYEKPVDLSGIGVSLNGVELEDREFIAAIREKREPESSVAKCLPTMRVLDRLERQLTGAHAAAAE
ncbi:Gfo/Idh/MocA family oxidoreductase [Pseudolabrys sp. FHR47]|uniref:Gfo/Idh/MocA family oxidoreductase n=1 Tax=Pseudolabrys sp. FHR47 TaxID=2562284 RepID=UPI0010BEFA75|nr:Gfo/Idh/MocA family oxidoreductase [Pseudolabrys sp. FHR47]